MPPPRDVAPRVRRARLPRRLRLEGLPGDRRRLRPSSPGGPRGVSPAARADLHPGDEGEGGPRREHRPRAGRRPRRRRALRRRGTALARALSLRGGVRGRARDHPRRHEVRARDRRVRDTRARRRDLHARLVPLLAGGRVRARRPAALVRQAVRARLLRVARLGQVRSRARAAGRRSSPVPVPATPRRSSA